MAEPTDKKPDLTQEEGIELKKSTNVKGIDGVDEVASKSKNALKPQKEKLEKTEDKPLREEEEDSIDEESSPVKKDIETSFKRGIKEKEVPTKKKGLSAQISFSRPSPLDVAISVRHLSLMLKSGLSLMDSLKTIQEQTTHPKLQSIYADVVAQVEDGKNLADSMMKYRKIFSSILISIVDVGEQAGTLEKNLIFIADYLKKQHAIKRKVRGALLYPLIILSLTLAEMAGVIFFVFPKLEDLFKSFDKIPAFTVAIMAGSEFVRVNILWFALGIFVAAIVFWGFSKTRMAKVLGDNVSIRFPIIKNLVKAQLLASFARTLGILMESGIPIAKAIKITSEAIDNVKYEKMLLETYENVKQGKNLASSLEKYPKFFPKTFVEMIKISEESGTLEENLLYLYEYHAEEIEDLVLNLTTILEPILIVFLGGSIALLAIMVIGPIYQLVGSINE